MKVIESKNAPAAVGPYSQAIQVGDLVFCSGQLGINPDSGQMEEGLEAQATQIFKNISNVLAEADLTLNDVVKATVFLTDIEDFAVVNEIYAQHFDDPFPARSAFAVTALPSNGLVEIEVIASK